MSSPETLRVVCLQRYPEYIEQTVTLLNNQWPRSRTARLRSLEQGSKDSLPTSLVLLQKLDNGTEVVIAHSKISPVPYQSQFCFVESVVVEHRLRGQGLGRIIMERTEEYVKSLGINTVYLTTIDQQGFYSKLGYELCEPIVVFGGSLKFVESIKNFSGCANHNTTLPNRESHLNNSALSLNFPDRRNNANMVIESQLPPPPPPPPPFQTNATNNNNAIHISKVTMRKLLFTPVF